MISMQDATLRRAQDFARDRGWRCEPLSWKEVEVLVELAGEKSGAEYCAGYNVGYASAMAKPIDYDRVSDWCAGNGYTLVKAEAS